MVLLKVYRFAYTGSMNNLLGTSSLWFTVARDIFQHANLSDDVAQVIMPDPSVQTHEQLEKFVRELTSSHGYYNGTCKMGSSSDPMAVTDKSGRVWGVGNLRVIDSSIIPDAPSGPLVSVCTMIAEKICDDIEMGTR